MANIKTYKIGDTTIQIDDTYFPKNEEEKQIVYEEFNKIACEILYSQKGDDLYGRN